VIFPPWLGSDTMVKASGNPLESVALAAPSMIPSLNVSVGLTVIGPAGSRLTAAPESSRRTAASCTHVLGESAGAGGAFPANGFNTPLIKLARMVKMLGGGGAALAVAGCIVTTASGATDVLSAAVDTDDGVDTVVAFGDTGALGVDTKVFVDGVFTTTWLAATASLGPALSVPVGEEPGEFAPTLADVDDRSDSGLLRGVTSAPVVLPVVTFGVEVVWSLACDEAADVDVAAVGIDWCARPVPTLPGVLALFFAPPILSTTPGPANVVDPVDVETPVNPDPGDVWVPVEGPVEVFADPEVVDEPAVLELPVALLVPELLVDEPEEFEDAGSAHAIP
jgi:hypothetical protein